MSSRAAFVFFAYCAQLAGCVLVSPNLNLAQLTTGKADHNRTSDARVFNIHDKVVKEKDIELNAPLSQRVAGYDGVSKGEQAALLNVAGAETEADFDVWNRLHVDILPDPAYVQLARQKTLLTTFVHPRATSFIPRRRRHRFRYVDFAKMLMEEGAKATPEAFEQPTMSAWTVCFFGSLAILGLFAYLIANCMQVKVEFEDDDDDLANARGRTSWDYACPAILIALTSMCFFMTVASVRMVNHEIVRHPTHREGTVSVTIEPITEPGKSGCEAGLGVAMSGFVACILTAAWRWRGNVQVNLALLGRFALRGATVAAVIAMSLELLGSYILLRAGLVDRGFALGSLLMMTIVGYSEEFGKCTAVVLGAWACAAALRKAQPTCMSLVFRVLVESPRALMLAGLSAGFGFMIIENVEYVMSVASAPPVHYDSDDIRDEGANSLMITTIFTICIRVLLNLHPWLTGVSAARVAKIVFEEGRDTAIPSFAELLWAITPSAGVHATFDFLVGGSGQYAVFMPLIFWGIARWMFMAQWDEATTWTPANAKLAHES